LPWPINGGILRETDFLVFPGHTGGNANVLFADGHVEARKELRDEEFQQQ